MQLTVRGKQIDVGDALRTHVADVLGSTTAKYFSQAIEATVVFSREAHLIRADVAVHAGRNILLQSNAEAPDAYGAFEQAADKMAKRLRRYKRRLRDHHRDGTGQPVLPAQSYVLEAEPDTPIDEERDEPAQPIVIADVATTVETMSVGQAVMRLDLGDLPALMFRNGAHGQLNMVYRRRDGNIGWIDPAPSGADVTR